ncbi:hypothetical protein [Legionella shakespearei]|uniref:Uncharacterized protein n=1 Tax=Legionella shakespearei DSM 23087 TaxID=1122169 RepID=A0A0W0YK20_9GAMM|nr:hypothetical protein [Legionella shakespearei]KTD57232.1 hypothetical protein Lsha_2614 [Legionella shakespearei DSM 23087]
MFTDYITKKNAYRAWNFLVATVVTLDLVQNEQARAVEYIPDIALHLWEAVAPDSLNTASLGVNLIRMVQAGRSFWTGESSIPTAANFADVYNHALNIEHRLGNLMK